MSSYYKNLNLRWIPILIFAVLLINGCRKDEHTTETGGPIFPNPSTTIESRLEGLVFDESGLPMPGVKLNVENYEAMSDENGFFRMTKLPLRTGGSLIKATIDDYIIGYKTVYPHLKSSSYVEFTLVKKTTPTTFNASNGGSVNTAGGGTIAFSPNSIVLQNGGTYSGEVKVYTHWYDPLDVETPRTMPGNLNGKDDSGAEFQLQSFGMMSVDLVSTDGKKLQLAEGKTAEINFPVLGLTSGAPDDLPLWHFDEDYGIWIQEGQATLEGDHYSGEVSHFSFWNCDVGIPLVEISGRLIDPSGVPVANQAVYVRLNNWFGGYEFTNSAGEFKGKVPKDRQLNLTVYHCGIKLVDEAIGPFANDTDLGDYEVQLTDYAFPLTGRFINCGDQPNANAYGVAKYTLISANADGTFGTIASGCGESSTKVTFVDPTTNSHKKMDIPTNQASVDLGDVKLCDLYGAYIAFTIDGDYASVATDPRAIFYDDKVDIRNYSGNLDGVYFQARLNSQLVGSQYPTSTSLSSILFNNNQEGNLACNDDPNTLCDDFEVTITETGGLDDTLRGSFKGSLYNFRDTINGTNETDIYYVEGSFNIPIVKEFNSITVKGKLWIDENNNGIQDGSEMLTRENNYFYIRKPNGSGPDFGTQYAWTDANGNYEFKGIEPGEYFVSAQLPQLSGLTAYNAGSDDTKDSDFYQDVNYIRTVDMVINDGETVENIDLGATIPDFKYNTYSFGGCIPELKLYIYVQGGVPPFTYELSDGQVNNDGTFDLAVGGNYTVTVTDALNRTVSENNLNVEDYSNFTSVIGFEDSTTGVPDVIDSSDKTYKGLKFNLFDESGTLILDGINNDNNGWLRFSYLAPGKYYIEVEVPSGYELVTKGVGTNEYADNDFDPTTGFTDVFEIIDCNENRQFSALLRKI